MLIHPLFYRNVYHLTIYVTRRVLSILVKQMHFEWSRNNNKALNVVLSLSLNSKCYFILCVPLNDQEHRSKVLYSKMVFQVVFVHDKEV